MLTADRLGIEKRYTDYRELLADPDVDVVSITTHIYDHLHIAIEALRSGKHVLMEKPMAPTAADCDQIIQAAAEGSGLFMVGHICRFDPRVALAKEAIEQGRIGKIISMHARRNLSKAIGRLVLDDISALMGDGIHDADLMLWFSQAKVSSVYAQEVHPGQNKYPDGGCRIRVAPAREHSVRHRRPAGGNRHGRCFVYQLRRGWLGNSRRFGRQDARHDVLAASLRQVRRRPAGRAALLRQLRSCGPDSTANHARGVAGRGSVDGRRDRVGTNGLRHQLLSRAAGKSVGKDNVLKTRDSNAINENNRR